MNSVSFQSTSRDSGSQLPATNAEAGTITLEASPKGPKQKATRFEKWLLGSVSERVLRYAHCPVMVVR